MLVPSKVVVVEGKRERGGEGGGVWIMDELRGCIGDTATTP